MKSVNQLTHRWAAQNGVTSFFLAETDSTNTWAKSDFKDHDFAIYLTDSQSRGRGRGQNTWTNADAGHTWLSTWSFRLQSAAQPIFPMRVGLTVFESFQHLWPQSDWALKAPNDIYLQGGKLGGILIEAEQTGAISKIHIGIGANIYSCPRSVGQATSCLSDEVTVQDGDWFKFCFLLSQRLRELQKDPQRQNLTKDEQARLLTALKNHSGNQIAEVFPDGGLRLENSAMVRWQDL